MVGIQSSVISYSRTMLTLRSVLAALVCSVAFGAPLGGDDPIVQKINDIIASGNDYFTDHLLTTISLPNIGILPWDPVKLTEGRLSQFNTIQLAGAPTVDQQQNADGSTTYTFYLDLTLNVLLVQYQFHAGFGILSVDGQVALSPQKHTLNAQGVVVVGPGSNCDARMSSAKITQFEDYQIDIEPNDIPLIGKVTETILNFVSPKLLGVVDAVINTSILLPSFQRNFSDLVCTNIKPNNH